MTHKDQAMQGAIGGYGQRPAGSRDRRAFPLVAAPLEPIRQPLQPAKTVADLVGITTTFPAQWREAPIADLFVQRNDDGTVRTDAETGQPLAIDPSERATIRKELVAAAMVDTNGLDPDSQEAFDRALRAQQLAAVRLAAGRPAIRGCQCDFVQTSYFE